MKSVEEKRLRDVVKASEERLKENRKQLKLAEQATLAEYGKLLLACFPELKDMEYDDVCVFLQKLKMQKLQEMQENQ